jgi:hypothetical protein
MAFTGIFGGGIDVYVTPMPPGVDLDLNHAGTEHDPYQSVKQAIEAVAGGGTVYLMAGDYYENVKLDGVCGKSSRRIVVQPQSGPVTINCLESDFLDPAAGQWIHVASPDPSIDEYVWSQPLDEGEANEVSRGAFLDRSEHIRLVSYGRLEDLQSPIQTWDKKGTTGNQMWERDDQDEWVPVTDPSGAPVFRHWVYMGPGIWFGKTAGEAKPRLHIRLNHTTNNIPGWDDYREETDPNAVRLALSKHLSRALFLSGCRHIRFKDLTLRFGGRETVLIRDSRDIVFEHVNFRAGSRAVRLENDADNQRISCLRLEHCEIDGGLPPWLFRSDRKDGYHFKPIGHENEDPVPNSLGGTTSNVLLSARPKGVVSRITIHHCEIFNGHDTVLFGDRTVFHHNWVNNLNDDSVFIGEAAGRVRAYQNVISRCLTALSFSESGTGFTQIFRNLIDIRLPTLGVRPPPPGGVVKRSLRQGQLYKGGQKQGPVDLWNNTCVTLDSGRIGDVPGEGPGEVSDSDLQMTTAGFSHYSAWDAETPSRRAFNNIFVAVYPGPDAKLVKPIAFLPNIAFATTSDSNSYHRLGPDIGNAFVVSDPAGGNEANEEYLTLELYLAEHHPHEQGSDRHDPKFKSFAANGTPQSSDDLRLGYGSPARHAAMTLPGSLRWLDLCVGGILTLLLRDRGCYGSRWGRLRVGVDGKRSFPA